MRNTYGTVAFFSLATLAFALPAQAQVLITEVQPNPAGAGTGDEEEWIELENVGTTSVSLGGWTLNDYTGQDPGGEATTRWTFAATASVAAGQVIVVARQATAFRTLFGRAPSYELAFGADDAAVPNLTPAGGTSAISLVNGATGDGVLLRDAAAAIVSGVEWGTVDRSVAGQPFTSAPGAGEALYRVNVTGSSSADFRITSNPTPFVGFRAAGPPIIAGTTARPRHAIFGGSYSVTSSVSDRDGLSLVQIYLATATSSSGAAAANYTPIDMTITGSTARFSAPVENLGAGLGFNDPTDFHSRYIRYYLYAEDAQGAGVTDPVGAVEDTTNAAYLPSYVQNVLPAAPTSIAAAREQRADGRPRWEDHSVRVQGVALVSPEIINPGRTQFALQDDSGRAISYFNGAPPAMSFDPGSRLEVVGLIDQFNGLTQIAGTSSVTILPGSGAVPTTTLTIAQILADPEAVESELVRIDDVDFETARAMWPNDAQAPASWNVTVSDGTGTITLRVTSATDIFGQAAPQFGFDVQGVLVEFTNNNGTTWEVFPRGSEDIFAHAAPPMDAGVADGAPVGDGGSRVDGGVNPRVDAGGSGNPPPEDGGCGCSTASPASPLASLALFALLGLCLALRRRR
ncbi:MAG: lamin tail domain-containing protein [Deltaproteobacteria bacterium]|nr:lamin tail domain-containing protein [Deltaproteobacteria bacterium]